MQKKRKKKLKKRKKEKRQFVILSLVFAALACERCEQTAHWPGCANCLPLTYAAINHLTPHKRKLGRGTKYSFWNRLFVFREQHHFIRLLRSHFLRGCSVSLWPWHPLFREHWYRWGIWLTSDGRLGRKQVVNVLALHKPFESSKSNLKEH